MDYEKRIGNGTAGSPAQMPVGGIPDNRHSARCRGGAVVQVFTGGKCGRCRNYCRVLHFVPACGAVFLKGRGKPQVFVGNGGRRGVFSGNLRGDVCGGRAGSSDEQLVHYDVIYLHRQRNAWGNARVVLGKCTKKECKDM